MKEKVNTIFLIELRPVKVLTGIRVFTMDCNKENEGKAITIYDIAKEANVSAATVSRVLTNSTNVRKDKRERILEIIEKYNFRPNAMARGLVDTRSKTIGIMVADIRNPFYSELFVACEAAACRQGYTVLLCNSYCDREQEKILLEMLEEKRVDAIIQMGGRVDEVCTNKEYAEHVNRTTKNIPMMITGKLDGTGCYRIQIDAAQSMEIVMEYLAGLGHQKIAFLGGVNSDIMAAEREKVYRRMLKKYGLPFQNELYRQEGNYDYETGYKQMEALFAAGETPTAVIAINECCAIGVMASIREHGLSIPEDISVMGYDNTFMSGLVTPKLTSIDYGYDEFGERIVSSAVAALEGQKVQQVQYVKTKLVVRDTTGSVNSGQK